jgi:hypothetical protein
MHPIAHGISGNPSLGDLRTNPKAGHISGITTTEAHAAIIVKQRTNPNGEDRSIRASPSSLAASKPVYYPV